MNGPVTIEIGELIVPGANAADGAIIADAAQRALGRLYREDSEAGVQWRETLASLTIDFDARLTRAELGEAIARRIRAGLVEPEQAR